METETAPGWAHGVAEVAAIIIMVVAPALLIKYYVKRTNKDGTERGIGWRAIQTIGMSMTIPALVLLALEGILTKDVTGALFGSIIGFIFAPKEKD